jgi:hypothetical protein
MGNSTDGVDAGTVGSGSGVDVDAGCVSVGFVDENCVGSGEVVHAVRIPNTRKMNTILIMQ